MTTKKYKKLLMSRGLDRNMAEKERQTIAYLRSRNYNTIKIEEIMECYDNLAERYVSVCGGSLRKWNKRIKETMKYIEEHCTV
jgi:hypothetical protein